MKPEVLSRNNHAFFYTQLSMFLLGHSFGSVVRSLAVRGEDDMRNPTDRFEVMTFRLNNGEMGYVQISKESADRLVKIGTFWCHKIPGNIAGDSNGRCFIANEEGLDITLQIIAHEGPRGIVFEQAVLQRISDDTPLGFFVAVCVTPTGQPVHGEELVCQFGD